jgi:hypothetical protein
MVNQKATEVLLAQGSYLHLLTADEIQLPADIKIGETATIDELEILLPVKAVVEHQVPLTPGLGRSRKPHASLALPAGRYQRTIQKEEDPIDREVRNNFD